MNMTQECCRLLRAKAQRQSKKLFCDQMNQNLTFLLENVDAASSALKKCHYEIQTHLKEQTQMAVGRIK